MDFGYLLKGKYDCNCGKEHTCPIDGESRIEYTYGAFIHDSFPFQARE